MTPIQTSIYRGMRPAQRLQVAFGLHDFAYRQVLAAITRDRRLMSDEEVRHEVVRRFIGEPGTLLRGGAQRP